eukprot:8098785-Pyramimonas_sp.AAC.1
MWKPSLREPPAAVANLARWNANRAPQTDRDQPKAKPPAKAAPRWVREKEPSQRARGSAGTDLTAQEDNPVAKAKAVETKARAAEDEAATRHGGAEEHTIPKAAPPTQTDGDPSSEESPVPAGADEAAIILRILKEVSRKQFSGKTARD